MTRTTSLDAATPVRQRALTSTRLSGALGLGIALSAVASLTLSACGGGVATKATSGNDGPTSVAAASPPAQSPVAATSALVRKVALGDTVTLPTDTFDVSRFVDDAAPDARKPDTPGTHWAEFLMKQCATSDSTEGRWKVALADGSYADEPTSWPQELPGAWLPSGEQYPAGYCSAGRVYIAMPDGALPVAVVLQPKPSGTPRPEVQWVIGRTSAAS